MSSWSVAVDCDGNRSADLVHAFDAKDSDALDQYADGNTFDRVEVHRAPSANRIVAGLQDDLGLEASDRGCARCDQSTTQPRNGRVA